ncbi:hypothetical protein CBR_g44912 [Chara braunii]|uniref:Uncharacterized protein n=1 Tax=Chara braunii TaxID=69332 RepID=A0A388LXY7_CHABU|nr:hypothetical protein CBR_g44912 [Chara braunii]|eukprot:GBG87177.1 hypothetical protein CBR_g44912 [Chara braunii]
MPVTPRFPLTRGAAVDAVVEGNGRGLALPAACTSPLSSGNWIHSHEGRTVEDVDNHTSHSCWWQNVCERTSAFPVGNVVVVEQRPSKLNLCMAFAALTTVAFVMLVMFLLSILVVIIASGRTGGGEGSSSGSAERGKTARDASEGSNSGTRAKRSASCRLRERDGTDESTQTLSIAMRESTTTYCQGLEQATCTLASASSKGAEIVGGRIGEMVGKIGVVADAMVGGNAVLAQLVRVLAARTQGSRRAGNSD